MTKKKELVGRQFMDDDGKVHELIPSSVLTSVPAARDAAEEWGEKLDFDFLDETRVLWLLHLRHDDVTQRTAIGCILGVPLGILGIAAWYFWDAYASVDSTQYQMATVATYIVLFSGMILASSIVGSRLTFNRSRRNVRIRARAYREMMLLAQREGAEVPTGYPFYGHHKTARKYFPQALEAEVPEGWREG